MTTNEPIPPPQRRRDMGPHWLKGFIGPMPWWFGPAIIINITLGLLGAFLLSYQEREFQAKATLVQLQAFVYPLDVEKISGLASHSAEPAAVEEAKVFLQRAFATIQRSNPSVTHCHILWDTGSNLKRVLTLPADDTVQATHELQNIPPDVWNALEGRQPTVSESLMHDRMFVRTAYIPILDGSRRQILVTAAFDINTLHWYPRILLAAGSPLLIMLLVMLLLVGSGLYFRKINEALNRADENRQRLQDIAASSADWIWETNAAGQFTYSSGQVVALLGCPAEAVLGRTLVDFLTFEESIRLGGFLAGVFALGEPISELECRVAGAHGKEVILQVAGVPVLDNNNVIGYRGVARNVTERRRDEERLRQLSRAIDATAEAVMVTDRLGHILTVNPAFTRTTGYSMHEAVGKKPSLLRSGRHDGAYYSDMWQTIRAQRVWQGTVENRRKDGSLYRAALTISPVLDEHGRHEGYVGVHRDVTAEYEASQALLKYNEDLRQAKLAAEEATRAKSEFLANMSHEIRTPLNAVIGMADLLYETDLMSEQREYTDVIRSGGESLLAVINDVLDFSKIEAGRMEFESRPFDVRAAVENVGDLLSATAFKKGLELIVSVEPDVPAAVQGDVVRLRQVLTNLTNNAIKFTEAGQVIIRCQMVASDSAQATLQFSISDTGIGIGPEALGRLFQSFSQVDASTTRRFGGTGLGLAISKRLVEGMGSDGIIVESEVGRGSTFQFTLRYPLAASEDNPSQRIIADDVFRDARVLIVDDIVRTSEVLESMLRHWGCRTTIAVSTEGAKDALKAAALSGEPYHVTLWDVATWSAGSAEELSEIQAIATEHRTGLILLAPLSDLTPPPLVNGPETAKVLTKPIKQSHLYNSLSDHLQLLRESASASKPDGMTEGNGAVAVERNATSARILIVDDNRINQLVAQRILQKLGYESEVANCGAAALERLGDGAGWDLVFMDCVLPDVSGEEVTRRFREVEVVRQRRLPIVAMTAEAGELHKKQCLEIGMDDYLSKPIQLHDILKILNRYVTTDTVSAV